MTPAHPMVVLDVRLRDADVVLAHLEMRRMSQEAAALAIEIKKVLEEGISSGNLKEAEELLGRYRALKI